jgi:hypothetical protein
MVKDRPRTITLRRSTVVTVGIVVAVLAALGVGVAIGLHRSSRSSPGPTKSIAAGASTTTSRGSTTTTTTTPLPAVLSCGPGSTPHLLPTQLKVGCATGSVTVTSITWKAWEAATGGQGTGTLNVLSANGTFSSTPATVVVFGVVNGVFQDVSIVSTISLTTTTTTPTITPTVTPTTGGSSPVIATQPGVGWGSD